MINLIPKRKQWKAWSLPSKLTAIGTLIGIISLGFYLIEKGHILLDVIESIHSIDDVNLVVELDNQTNKSITLFGRGETFFWYPGGAEHRSYAFEVVKIGDKTSYSSNIEIPEKSKIRVVIRLLPKNEARLLLEQGHMDLSLYFKGTNGENKISSPVGFSEENIKSGYISIAFKESAS